MNLAQLVDAEAVQQGLYRRIAPKMRPIEQAPVAPVVRSHAMPEPVRPRNGAIGNGGPTRTVLMALAGAGPMGLFAANVRQDTRLTAYTVSSVLGTLVLNGRAEKVNAKRPFRFAITPKGRAYLERGPG